MERGTNEGFDCNNGWMDGWMDELMRNETISEVQEKHDNSNGLTHLYLTVAETWRLDWGDGKILADQDFRMTFFPFSRPKFLMTFF